MKVCDGNKIIYLIYFYSEHFIQHITSPKQHSLQTTGDNSSIENEIVFCDIVYIRLHVL